MLLNCYNSTFNRGSLGLAIKWGCLNHVRPFSTLWYHKFPTEVKVDYPPKPNDRSDIWKLPDSKTLLFVSNGWYYKPHAQGESGKKKKVVTTTLTFAKAGHHHRIDSFTEEEVFAFEALVPKIKDGFKKQKAFLAEQEQKDQASAHSVR